MSRRVFVLSGEVSGDIYAGRLISRIRHMSPDCEIYAMGGRYSYSAGAKVLADPTGIAVVGLVEVLKHIKEFRFIYNTIKTHILSLKPDAIVFVDYPGFNLRLAKDLRKKLPDTKFIYYIAPQVWAWGKGRVNLMRKVLDELFVIFPFEEDFFRKNGINARFVGHPLAEIIKGRKVDKDFRGRYSIPEDKPLILLMPGSRLQEIARHLPVMISAVRELREKFAFCLNRAYTIPEYMYKQHLGDMDVPLIEPDEHPSSLHFSELVWVASGTAVVETMFYVKPMIVVYRVSPITYAIGRWLVNIKYISMANILAGKELVPELVQGRFTPDALLSWTERIVYDTEYRSQMVTGLKKLAINMAVYNPEDIVAKAVLV